MDMLENQQPTREPEYSGTCALRRGFTRAVLQTLRCKADAVLSMGPPCGSFVFVNLHTSKRSATTPYGDEKKDYVELGSLLFKSNLERRFLLFVFQGFVTTG